MITRREMLGVLAVTPFIRPRPVKPRSNPTPATVVGRALIPAPTVLVSSGSHPSPAVVVARASIPAPVILVGSGSSMDPAFRLRKSVGGSRLRANYALRGAA